MGSCIEATLKAVSIVEGLINHPGGRHQAPLHWVVPVLIGAILSLVGVLRYHGPAYRSDEMGDLSEAATPLTS